MLLDMNATRQHCKEAESTKIQQRPWQWWGLAKKSRATRTNNTGKEIQLLHPLSLLSSSPRGAQSCSSSRQQHTGDVSGREQGKRVPKYLIKGTHPRYGADVVGDGDQSGPGQVLFADRFPLLLAHHVSKAVKTVWGLKLPSQFQEKTGTANLTKVIRPEGSISNFKKHCHQ